MNSEPSRRHMYLFGTEDINETSPVLYNLHIVEGYDLAGAIRKYSELYNLDDTYENPVLIREVEQWRGEGPLSGFGVRPRPDKTKPEQDESDEEATMKESNNDNTPVDVIEYSRIFNIAADIQINLPYLLIRKSDDGWGEDITPIVILGIRTTEIEYTYWGKFAETTGVRTVITPDDFVENGYKLVRLTGDMIKELKK